MESTLKNKTVKALAWNTLNKGISQVIFTIVGLYLALVLAPEEFGLIAIPVAISTFLIIFTDSGFAIALIQRKDIKEDDYNTVFLFNLALSVFLYIVLFFTIPFIADLYNNEKLIPVSRFIFLGVIIQAFGFVQNSKLVRAMNFKAIAIADLTSVLISGVAAVVLAYFGYGVWALVVQQLLNVSLRTFIIWLQVPWTLKFRFNKTSFLELNKVGLGIFLTSFVSTTFQQVYTFIIGKISFTNLGYYNRAESWSKIGVTIVNYSVGQSLLPALSSVQDDEERMHRVYGKMNKMTAYITFPLFLFMIVAAKPIFRILFSTKWDPSIILFQLLLIKGIFFIFVAQMNQYLMALGKTKSIFKMELIKDACVVIAIVFTIRHGVEALVWGQLVVGIIHYIITAIVMGKITHYSPQRQLKNVFPYFAIAVCISAIAAIIPYYIQNMLLIFVLQLSIFIVLYFLANNVLNSKIQAEMLSIVKGKIFPKKHK